MKKGRVGAQFDEEYTKANRKFPIGRAILLAVAFVIQIILIVAVALFDPQPQDVIRQYDVTVEAREDGTLDVTYHFVWEACDTSEKLTWIEIGMPNPNYTVYPDSLSDTIRKCTPESYDGQVYLILDLSRPYEGGEVLEFSFRVNQRDMLCRDENGYFYELIPGWFNATPTESYTFRWAADERIVSVADAEWQHGYYVLNGALGCGEYVPIEVRYEKGSFDGCATVPHEEFDDSGAYNSLAGDKAGAIVMVGLVVSLLILLQIYVVDSFVSYRRGRGFLTGHGHYVHIYGRSNPHYVRARNHYHAGRHGGGGGGGCACACACACAGGGRAGCSQKDTYGKKNGANG